MVRRVSIKDCGIYAVAKLQKKFLGIWWTIEIISGTHKPSVMKQAYFWCDKYNCHNGG